MKTYKYLFAATLFVLLGTSVLFFCSYNSSVEVADQKVEVLSFTKSIPVPKSVEFCGKEINLDRYDMHERYDREINSFTYFHGTTLLMIKRANRYFPIIEPILKENGIPDDFKYLACAESSLNSRAISPVKAAGMWQFMEETAKSFGLEVNSQIDERYHIVKSTEAACKYLKNAYSKYGDWISVAASYNGGTARISSELQKQMVDTSFDLLLVEETSRYMFRIIALKELFKNPYKYGFVVKKDDLYPTIRTTPVEISETIDDFAAFAKRYNLTYAQLKDFNVWLRDRGLTISEKKPKTYVIDIPVVDDLYYSKNKVKVHDKAWIEQ